MQARQLVRQQPGGEQVLIPLNQLQPQQQMHPSIVQINGQQVLIQPMNGQRNVGMGQQFNQPLQIRSASGLEPQLVSFQSGGQFNGHQMIAQPVQLQNGGLAFRQTTTGPSGIGSTTVLRPLLRNAPVPKLSTVQTYQPYAANAPLHIATNNAFAQQQQSVAQATSAMHSMTRQQMKARVVGGNGNPSVNGARPVWVQNTANGPVYVTQQRQAPNFNQQQQQVVFMNANGQTFVQQQPQQMLLSNANGQLQQQQQLLLYPNSNNARPTMNQQVNNINSNNSSFLLEMSALKAMQGQSNGLLVQQGWSDATATGTGGHTLPSALINASNNAGSGLQFVTGPPNNQPNMNMAVQRAVMTPASNAAAATAARLTGAFMAANNASVGGLSIPTPPAAIVDGSTTGLPSPPSSVSPPPAPAPVPPNILSAAGLGVDLSKGMGLGLQIDMVAATAAAKDQEELHSLLTCIGTELSRHGICVTDAIQAGWLGVLSPEHAAIITQAHEQETQKLSGNSTSVDGLTAAAAEANKDLVNSNLSKAMPSANSEGDAEEDGSKTLALQHDTAVAAAVADPTHFSALNFDFFGDGKEMLAFEALEDGMFEIHEGLPDSLLGGAMGGGDEGEQDEGGVKLLGNHHHTIAKTIFSGLDSSRSGSAASSTEDISPTFMSEIPTSADCTMLGRNGLLGLGLGGGFSLNPPSVHDSNANILSAGGKANETSATATGGEALSSRFANLNLGTGFY
ncbi:hypothetical protein CEUSTIGMA_g13406.t1 [Chlamydomonas eustigma]|uniref:Uncharacterized protein n=1 Tax=Chlamydomonas eustigma TaxID=1157962 RepID=A0A250XT65_9CHLO|nr:hypothetical protein CEUSTIGMA_g13406.t1 [Chlamydomonas eustigma]|eukprot:GAX85990.1 hypothetical protein CEUSTIGMA_g13406.t1 [Chlamydomonas eustigma]